MESINNSYNNVEKLKEEIQHLKERIEFLDNEFHKYKHFFQTGNNPVFIINPEGKFLEVNNVACERLGYKEEELLSKSIFDLIPDKDNAHIKNEIDNARDGEYKLLETALIKGNGEPCPVEMHIRSFRFGEQAGVLIAAQSISIVKKHEEELEKERELLHALMDNIPDTIYFKDRDSKFTRINKAQAELLGVENLEDAIGKTDFDFFTREHAEDAFKDEQNLMKTKTSLVSKREKIRHASGEFKWVTATKVPVYDKRGNVSGMVGITRYITELVEAENKIMEYADDLKFLNASKDKFFSIIAHDLKNPFIGLLGYTEMLLSEFDNLADEKKLEYINNIKSASESSYRLLDNLLQWSRSQTGRIQYRPSKIDIKTIVYENIELLKNLASKKSVELSTNIQQSIFAYGDSDMIKNVIRNLIMNAIKFTGPDDAIAVSTKEKEEMIEVSVADTGVGIDEDTIKKLFRIDTHVSTSGTSNESGTGLGLIICKEFVEKNGGKISVESIIGKGSIFKFTIPKFVPSE